MTQIYIFSTTRVKPGVKAYAINAVEALVDQQVATAKPHWLFYYGLETV
jgi:hypothetical protein